MGFALRNFACNRDDCVGRHIARSANARKDCNGGNRKDAGRNQAVEIRREYRIADCVLRSVRDERAMLSRRGERRCRRRAAGRTPHRNRDQADRNQLARAEDFRFRGFRKHVAYRTRRLHRLRECPGKQRQLFRQLGKQVRRAERYASRGYADQNRSFAQSKRRGAGGRSDWRHFAQRADSASPRNRNGAFQKRYAGVRRRRIRKQKRCISCNGFRRRPVVGQLRTTDIDPMERGEHRSARHRRRSRDRRACQTRQS